MPLARAGNQRFHGRHIRNLVAVPNVPPRLLYPVGYFRNVSVVSLIALNLENFYSDF